MNALRERRFAGRLRFFFSQLRTRLLLSYFLIILLGIALVGTASYYISTRSTEERMESASYQIVRQIENNMDNDFHSKRNLLLAPYFTPDYIDGINGYAEMSAENKFLFSQQLGNLYLKSFNITPVSGFIRFQIYYSDGELMNASDAYKPGDAAQVRSSEWFLRTVAKDGEVFFSGPISGDARNTKADAAYSSSILIRDFSNPDRFIVVRAEYDADLFSTIGQNDGLSPNSRILILDENNTLIYASADREKFGGDADLLARLSGGEGKFRYDIGKRDEMLVSYTQSNYSGWKAVLVIPRSDITGPLNRIKTTVVATALVALAFTLLVSVLLGRSIAKPVLNLYKTVNRIKRGDFSVRVEVGRNDEIGRIAMNFNAMQDELQHLIESRYLNQIRLQEVELAMLYSQINPHFLYNTLDSIRAMSDYYGAPEVGGMAQALADMFRYNTRNRDEIVTLQEELVQIDAYMKIQSIRFEDKIVYEQRIEEEAYAFPMLKMTLQPLVENAVSHGIERKRGKGRIRIEAAREGDRLRLTVSDDGVGISERRLAELRAELAGLPHGERFSQAASEGGIGVRNVYARYAIRFGDKFEFRIDSRKGEGTSITMLFPG